MRKVIETSNAPAPLGPYNQAILAGNTLYISGQVPIEPTFGKLISNSIEEETRQVMENLRAILNEAGFDFQHVVKVSIFLTDLATFDQMNKVYDEYFDSANAPARECIEASRLPKDVHIEISCIAVK